MDPLSLESFEIPSDLIIKPTGLSIVKNQLNVKKRMFFTSQVAKRDVGKFKRSDPKLLEFEKEVNTCMKFVRVDTFFLCK